MHVKQPDCCDCIRYDEAAHKADPEQYVCSANHMPFPAVCWDSHARVQQEQKKERKA